MTSMETTTATTKTKKTTAKHGCRECGAALPTHRFVCSPCLAAKLEAELGQFTAVES